jgi:predicted DNA-binding antitoxin AbrB/MazE fold protein
MRPVEAHYEGGLLRPATPLPLKPGERVGLIVIRLPDPCRWNPAGLAKHLSGEDEALAESGIAEWSRALQKEDRS